MVQKIDVSVFCLGVDYDVVQVDETSQSFEIGKNDVQNALKRLRCICKPE